MKPTIDGKLPIDIQRLLETRLLLQASSGGGKSYAIRRLLEQTANQVQQIVIDPDGEFATLREKFDYIIAAPQGGDAVAHPRTAALLARRLLESGVSAILDIYELKAHERVAFVKEFCNALVNAPKKLWRPVLIVVDEAHVYCPEKGKGQADSGSAIIDLATRGRKRGFGLTLATQRISKLNKDAAAECLNKMIGMTGLLADRSRAADELGMTAKEASAELRGLQPGDFFIYGPAFSQELTKVKVGQVKTTHPEPGSRALEAPPAPSAKIKKALAELGDLPKEAEQEAQTLADLKRTNAELKRKIAQLEKQPATTQAVEKVVKEKPTKAELQALVKTIMAEREAKGFGELIRLYREAMDEISRLAEEKRQQYQDQWNLMRNELLNANAVATEAQQRFTEKADGATWPNSQVSTAEHKAIEAEKNRAARQRVDQAATTANGNLTGPEQRILDALVWLESANLTPPFSRIQVAFIAGYKPNSGGFNNPLGRLRSAGYIEYPGNGQVAITDNGRALAHCSDAVLSNTELHQRILARLNGPQQRILQHLIEAYPNSLSREELAVKAGYAANSGGFNNPLGAMRSLGLIEYPQTGYVVAQGVLFPMEK